MTYYGQWETDKEIEKYFPNQNAGVCIEVGAYDGIKGSNSKRFEDVGWKTYCIEPNPYIYPTLCENRPGKNFNLACGKTPGHGELEIFDFRSGIQSSLTSLNTDPRLVRDYYSAIERTQKVIVSIDTLNNIIIDNKIDNIDFISIDTEGTELDVLIGLNLNVNRPKLLVVENNYDDKDITEYLLSVGYSFAQRYYVNNFYVDNQTRKIK